MKKIVKIAIGIFAVALIVANINVLNAQVALPTVSTDEGYSEGQYTCPNGKTVYRCWSGGSGCSVGAQDLC